MTTPTLHLSYLKSSGATEEIFIKGPEFGSDETWSRRQQIGRTLGNLVYVYDLGKDELELNIQLDKLSDEERADLEWFFAEQNVNLCRRWFTVDLPAPVRRSVLRAGALVGGVSVKAGDYKAGQFVKQDTVRYIVRLISPSISFVEAVEGYYSTTLVLHVLFGFLPANDC